MQVDRGIDGITMDKLINLFAASLRSNLNKSGERNTITKRLHTVHGDSQMERFLQIFP